MVARTVSIDSWTDAEIGVAGPRTPGSAPMARCNTNRVSIVAGCRQSSRNSGFRAPWLYG